MKAWIKVSAVEKMRDGRSRAMFLRWKNAVRVTCFMCGSNESVGSRVMPRLRMSGDGVRTVLLKLRQKLWVDFVMFFGLFFLSLLSFRKLRFIHVLISVKQFVRVEWTVEWNYRVKRDAFIQNSSSPQRVNKLRKSN